MEILPSLLDKYFGHEHFWKGTVSTTIRGVQGCTVSGYVSWTTFDSAHGNNFEMGGDPWFSIETKSFSFSVCMMERRDARRESDQGNAAVLGVQTGKKKETENNWRACCCRSLLLTERVTFSVVSLPLSPSKPWAAKRLLLFAAKMSTSLASSSVTSVSIGSKREQIRWGVRY